MAKTVEARDRTPSTASTMRLARKNHQYSARLARPMNWAYRWRTTTFHQLTSCIRPSLSVGWAGYRSAVAPCRLTRR